MGQSALFAERLRNEVGKDTLEQINRAFRLSYGRPPDVMEMQASQSFLKKQGVDPAEIPEPDKAALVDLCHSLFNSNEFVYVN
jgi:hypothetical protein